MTLSNKEKLRLQSKYGPWALVSGASSGIGKALAERLADAGLNLIINARSKSSLDALKGELEESRGVEVKVVATDLSSSEGIQELIRSTAHMEIGLLVASAGFGTSGNFLDTSVHAETNMMRVNMEALLVLTHHFSQYFANKQKGGIILLSSMVAFQGVPFASNYAATKAYVQTLAEGISVELKPHHVDVLAAAPGPVSSGFAKRANMQMDMTLSPEDVAVPILKALGRKTTVLPGFLTKLLVYSLRTAPRSLKVRIMKQVMGGMTAHQRKETQTVVTG
ncbi:MAG: SDR family NAD(P)-dependent oxidoreductase [Bacteroidota bacterium]